MSKIFNLKGIGILLGVLVILHFLIGFIISPFVAEKVLEAINSAGGAKVKAEKIMVWPLTLSASLKNMKVFDSEGKERILSLKKASIKLSFIGLLSKRVVISSIKGNGVEVNLRAESDGTFNVERLADAPGEKKPFYAKIPGVKLRGGNDWFSKIYSVLKSKGSTESREQQKELKVKQKEVSTEIEVLPQGRRVSFETVRSGYLFEIQKIYLRNIKIKLQPLRVKPVDIDHGIVSIKGVYFDPEQGVNLSSAKVSGILVQDEKFKGKISLLYKSGFKRGDLITEIKAKTDDVDLPALAFIYYDSLPVIIDKGFLSLDSNTVIINDTINSKNSMTFTDHQVRAKSPNSMVAGFAPMSAVADAINQVNPFRINFTITGTLEHPKFEGLKESLKQLIQPYIAKMMKELQQEGVNALTKAITKQGGSSTGGESEAVDQAINALKGFLNR